MKSLLLSLMAGIVCFIAITIAFRAARVRRRAMTMVCVFFMSVPIFIVAEMVTPPNLGVLPPFLVISPPWFDLAFGTFIYTAAFFGGILQIYNLADRGFSLRMLIDIGESPRGILAADEMLSAYSRGHGLRWMYQKRLDGLMDHGLILISDGMVSNSAKGRRIALIYDWLRAFLHFAPRN